MYNLAIAIGIAAAAFLLGWAGGNTWVAGFIPGFLALIISYVLLARRTGQQLEVVLRRAMAEFESLKPEKLMAIYQKTRSEKAVQDARAEVLGKVRGILNEGFALERWQFLVGSQIHAQLGALDYMDQDYASARGHLEKAWSRNWMSQVQLSAIDWREDRRKEALARLEKAKGPGEKEALFWGVYTWMMAESGDVAKALLIVSEGLKKIPGHKALGELADALRNQKKIQVSVFGDAWYQFFPEHLTETQKRAMAEQYAPRQKHGFRPPPQRFPRR